MIAVINYSGRTSKLGGIVNLLTDDGPILTEHALKGGRSEHALSVHLSRAKLITRFRRSIFKVRSLGQSSRGKYPYF